MEINRVEEELGGESGNAIAFPAKSLAEAKRRLQKAEALFERGIDDYIFDELETLSDEIELMKDQIAWFTGYSNLRDEDGNNNYFLFITPGASYRPSIGESKSSTKQGMKEQVRKDLAKYYRFSPSMRREKSKLIKDLVKMSNKYHELFGRFGKDIILTTEDTVVSYRSLEILDNTITRLIEEDKYVEMASRIRNPYVSLDRDFSGIYRKVIVSFNGRRWFNREPKLKDLLEYVDDREEYEDSVPILRSGLMVYKTLETMIRIALHGRTEKYIKNGKKTVRYRSTDEMVKFIGAPEYIGLFEVGKLARSLLVEPSSDMERDFINAKSGEDTEDIKYITFITVMAEVKVYYDHIRDA